MMVGGVLRRLGRHYFNAAEAAVFWGSAKNSKSGPSLDQSTVLSEPA